MRTQLTIATLLLIFILLNPYIGHAQDNSIDYLRQIPPGDTPKRFAPGIITGFKHSPIAISPHGDEIFWVETEMISAQDARERIKSTRYQNGTWTNPAYAGFVGGYLSYHHSGTVFSPDGDRLYFISNRPGGLGDFDLWYVEKNETGWGTPVNAGEPYNTTGHEISPVFTNTGRAYRLGYTNSPASFTYSNGIFSSPVSIDNQPVTDWYSSVYISPEEEYVIFAGDDTPNLYIRFRNHENDWSDPINMGDQINTSQPERFPVVSPDGKYLFFLRGEPSNSNNYFWVSTSIIDEIKRTQPDPNGLIQNTSSSQRFNSIQGAISCAKQGDTLVLQPGVYEENITLDKDVILQSVDPNDPDVTAETIIEGDGTDLVVELQSRTQECVLAGLTIRGGGVGIWCSGGQPVIRGCRIVENAGPGIELRANARPAIDHCIIVANGGLGVTMPTASGRGGVGAAPALVNCTIVQNAQGGTYSGAPVMRNCIIYHNGPHEAGPQIVPTGSQVTYSCIQGGFTGAGNITADPLFVRLGRWTEANDVNDPSPVWLQGDYHLQSRAGCWDPNSDAWVRDELTSPCIDAGNPSDAVGVEPQPNGDRINMGAYGGSPQASKSPCAYAILDLGTLGGTESCAYGLNDLGDVVGDSKISGNAVTRAFLYRKGSMTSLGTLGGSNSRAFAINTNREVAGYSDITGNSTQHAYLYSNEHMTDLGTLGGSGVKSYSWAHGINDSGQVVGGAYTAGGQEHAFVYISSHMTDLGTLNATASQANCINAAGMAAGYSFIAGYAAMHAAIFCDGQVIDIGTFGGSEGDASAINDSGQVAGIASISNGNHHAFLYSNEHMKDLGTLGGAKSEAYSINNQGQVVGMAYIPGDAEHAFLYSGGNMNDLNGLIPADSGWTLTEAFAINNPGQIAGRGVIRGRTHAFLMTPVPQCAEAAEQ